MTKASLIELVRLNYLEQLRVYRYTQTDVFMKALNRMSETDIKDAKRYIEAGDLESLKSLIEGVVDYESMPIMKLRLLAKGKRVQYYAQLTKEQLIKELIEIDTPRSSTTPH